MASNKHTVLITSAGTASGVNVIKALKKQTELDLKLVAVDADILAPGLYLADTFEIVPLVKTGQYIPSILNICKKYSVNILIPIYSQEIETVAQHKNEFERIGVKTLLPEVDVISICNNKAQFTQFCHKNGITTPPSYSESEANYLQSTNYPLFIKPKISSSSKNAFPVKDKEELQHFLKTIKNVLIQKFIKGTEVTVDVFCDAPGHVCVVSPRVRIETKAGQMVKGITINKDKFVPLINKIMKALNYVGVSNIQFIQMETGKLVLIEINPRFAAGGLMLTVNAGANIPLLMVKQLLNLPIRNYEYEVKENMYMTRYWEEIFI